MYTEWETCARENVLIRQPFQLKEEFITRWGATLKLRLSEEHFSSFLRYNKASRALLKWEIAPERDVIWHCDDYIMDAENTFESDTHWWLRACGLMVSYTPHYLLFIRGQFASGKKFHLTSVVFHSFLFLSCTLTMINHAQLSVVWRSRVNLWCDIYLE